MIIILTDFTMSSLPAHLTVALVCIDTSVYTLSLVHAWVIPAVEWADGLNQGNNSLPGGDDWGTDARVTFLYVTGHTKLHIQYRAEIIIHIKNESMYISCTLRA